MNRHLGRIIVDERLGGIKRYSLGLPDDWNMEVPKEILRSVAFICVKETDGITQTFEPCGTGFFVSVQSANNLFHLYFVTAKHIIEETRGMEISVKVNNGRGASMNITIANGFSWITHPDENVDVAITPFALPIETNLISIPIDMALKKEDIDNGNIGIGDDVFITGLFTHHHGKFENLPIVRMGNIAMLPNEKVSVGWHDGVDMDAYLIEARSIGGISGSPVFFGESHFKRNFGKESQIKNALRFNPKFYLGGLIHGHWKTDISKIDKAKSIKEEENVNMGIAIVTPASKIVETLMQDSLVEMRKEIDAEHERAGSTQIDDSLK